jgi:hypothetical protein
MMNSGSGLWLFSDGSSVTSMHNLQTYASWGCSDSMLIEGIERQDIRGENRQLLVDELAKRHLLSGRFKDFCLLLERESTVAQSAASSLSRRLAANLRDIDALVDFGEFLYKSDINIGHVDTLGRYIWRGDPGSDLPGCIPCKGLRARVSSYVPPIWYFLTAVELSQDSKVKSEAEAKALHYIVRGGRSRYKWQFRTWWNYRGNDQPALNSVWAFQRLHKLYKNSPWAATTPYWYK